MTLQRYHFLVITRLWLRQERDVSTGMCTFYFCESAAVKAARTPLDGEQAAQNSEERRRPAASWLLQVLIGLAQLLCPTHVRQMLFTDNSSPLLFMSSSRVLQRPPSMSAFSENGDDLAARYLRRPQLVTAARGGGEASPEVR